MQTIIEFFSNADNIASVLSGVFITSLTIGKVWWDWRKEKKLETPKEITTDSSIDILSDAYLTVIKELQDQLNSLKEEVTELGALKEANLHLEREIMDLKRRHRECTEQNEKQAAQIVALSRKVNRLVKNKRK
jgi:predicted RNase H-like nuclease (RuvC/YqgF family)